MSWKEARRQCWKWGGDLAFILSNRTDVEECMQPTFIADKEEVSLEGQGSIIFYSFRL